MTETTQSTSPQPASPLQRPTGPPVIPGPIETAAMAWRRLRRMSTALMFLFTLAIATILATFIPQEPVIPTTVNDWRVGVAGPGSEIAAAFDWLGLFDIFGSWWFAVIAVLLLVSLTGCLVPRWRAFVRTVRRRPPAGRNLGKLSSSVTIEMALPPGKALEIAEATLRRRRFRTTVVESEGGTQIAGERGHWREGGSLVFHSSFYLLLIGAVVGHTFGFTGQINVPEGSEFAETRIAYDLAEPGRSWDLADHRGFVVRLEGFDVAFYDNLVPRDFVSTITILEEGQEVRSGQVRVNHPLTHDGMKIFQARWGMAPRVVVRAGDRVLFDEHVMLNDAGGWIWTGVAKVSLGGLTETGRAPQMALEIVFLPDAALNEEGTPFGRSPIPENPRLIADLWIGDELGLERPVPARQFNRDGGRVIGPPAILAAGTSMPMADGLLQIEFPELAYWSGFQVSHAPGRGLLLVAGGLLLAGLLPSLYSYRRRIWAATLPVGSGEEVQPHEGSRLVLAGVALQRKQAFAEEFAAVKQDLEQALEKAT